MLLGCGIFANLRTSYTFTFEIRATVHLLLQKMKSVQFALGLALLLSATFQADADFDFCGPSKFTKTLQPNEEDWIICWYNQGDILNVSCVEVVTDYPHSSLELSVGCALHHNDHHEKGSYTTLKRLDYYSAHDINEAIKCPTTGIFYLFAWNRSVNETSLVYGADASVSSSSATGLRHYGSSNAVVANSD